MFILYKLSQVRLQIVHSLDADRNMSTQVHKDKD